ncbi:MAG: hypothetical protein ABR987_04805 [Terracidiphilus sp.]
MEPSIGLRRVLRFAVLLVSAAGLAGLSANAAAGQWEQPAAALAEQIATILGPAQAHLIIRNNSRISNDEIPTIRRLLEQDLKARGIQASGAESANVIRITLSEDLRERLWVAEIVEGNETRVAMIRVEAASDQQQAPLSGLTLRKQVVLTALHPVLATIEMKDNLVAIEPEEIVIYAHSAGGWKEQIRVSIGQKKPLTRDSRAVIYPSSDSQGFEASVAGMFCTGISQLPAEWTIHCHESDDPWFLTPPQPTQDGTAADMNIAVTPLRAFYNAARNYFTGVVTPSLGADLPSFYTAVLLPRSDSGGLLLNGIDGKVQFVESGRVNPVTGARDWGSDFAALRSGCGAGTQIIASGSGEAIADSLRAYELPALEAIPASAPLTMDGTVTALWTAADTKSVFAVVRKPAAAGQTDPFEVDRVTANCD